MIFNIQNKILETVGKTADDLGYEAYVIGGYVRDYILGKESDDIDIVVVGKGKVIAEEFSKRIGSKEVSFFENFGTAMVKTPDGIEVEFVGARKESYDRGSRKPVVEDGTLMDDQLRRDFTINAMGICLNSNRYGELMDSFNGLDDIKNKIIRTPTNPDITFSDDPLRQFRAIRFAVKLGFSIQEKTFDSIKKNSHRISILSVERITTELNKILSSPDPVRGINLLYDTGLLEQIIPEICNMNSIGDSIHTRRHKNIYLHTMKVLQSVSDKSNNLWLRWAALLHDVGKMPVRRYENDNWSFTNHEIKGAEIVEKIFRRLKLPLGDELKFVKKMVSLHMRPQLISSLNDITDAAVRRLVFDANDNIDELLILCESDITTNNLEKKDNFVKNYENLKQRIEDLKHKDFIREFQPCLTGDDIMREFNLSPGKTIGIYKKIVKDAVLDGVVENNYEDLLAFLKQNIEK